jgi:aminopeptidase N
MEKSGSLTRMMEYLFTMPVFKLGLRYYLLLNSYKGASQDSLFEALDTTIDQFSRRSEVLPPVPGVTVKTIMDTWTLQTGYPLVRVSRAGGLVTLTQENIITIQPNNSWWVPIKLVTQENPVFTSHTTNFWLSPELRNTTYPTNSTGWVIVNPDAVGFYRVLYDSPLATLIDQELARNADAFTPITRAQLVDDRINLGLTGHIPLLESVKIVSYISKETNAGVLFSVVTNVKNVLNRVKDTNQIGRFKEVLIPALENILETIGEENQFDKMGLTNILRNSVIKLLCDYGSKKCATVTSKYFHKLKSTAPALYESVVPKNIQDSVYCGILKTGGAEARSFFKRWYKVESDPVKSKQLFKALENCRSSKKF